MAYLRSRLHIKRYVCCVGAITIISLLLGLTYFLDSQRYDLSLCDVGRVVYTSGTVHRERSVKYGQRTFLQLTSGQNDVLLHFQCHIGLHVSKRRIASRHTLLLSAFRAYIQNRSCWLPSKGVSFLSGFAAQRVACASRDLSFNNDAGESPPLEHPWTQNTSTIVLPRATTAAGEARHRVAHPIYR